MLNEQTYVLGNGLRSDTYARPRISVLLPPVNGPAKQEVFAEAILEKSSTHQKRNPLKWAVSLCAHIAVLSILLLMPLYFSQGLNLQKLNVTLLVAPLPPSAAPPPPPLETSRAVARTVPKNFTPGKLTAPAFVPRAVVTMPDAAPPEMTLVSMSGGILGGIPGGQIGGILGGVLNGVAAPPTPSSLSEGPKKPVRVGGDIKPPTLLSGPPPVYPVLARQSRIQGIVVIEAIIDEHGNIVGEKVISGHPLLVASALKAVSLRKYAPTILDGEPTPVDFRVEVTFHLE